METGKPRRLRFSLGQDAAYDEGLICGGQLEVFIEPVEPQNRALIFGAGHISKSIAQLTGLLGFHTSVVDNRESFANRERFPGGRRDRRGRVRRSLPVADGQLVVVSHHRHARPSR
jgi:xanthine dehydrogenase accessory factor